MLSLVERSGNPVPRNADIDFEEQDIIWLGGLLANGGFVSEFISGRKESQCWRPAIIVTGKEEGILLKVSSILGCKVQLVKSRTHKTKICYRVCVSGKRALHFMREILPYVGEVRKKEIRRMLDKFSTLSGW